MSNQTQGRRREFDLENGNKLIAEQRDPYGHWFLHLERGSLPEKYQGAYTDINVVHREVERYITDRKLALSAVDKAKKAS
jgi:hypothetical protein